VITPVAVNQRAIASGDAHKDSTGIIVADIVQNIYSTTRGDMINVQLRIVGDPEFIKQDDLFLNPLINDFVFDYSSQYVSTNKDGDPKQGIHSLNFDSGTVLVKLNFQTPTDMDEQTGTLKIDGKFQTGVFSGVYRVISVTSEFRQGKFEQVLQLVRLFDQEEQLKFSKERQETSDTAAQEKIESSRSTLNSLNPTGYDESYAKKEAARARATTPIITIENISPPAAQERFVGSSYLSAAQKRFVGGGGTSGGGGASGSF
jgi:3-dehydroquinate dehydratase